MTHITCLHDASAGVFGGIKAVCIVARCCARALGEYRDSKIEAERLLEGAEGLASLWVSVGTHVPVVGEI